MPIRDACWNVTTPLELMRSMTKSERLWKQPWKEKTRYQGIRDRSSIGIVLKLMSLRP